MIKIPSLMMRRPGLETVAFRSHSEKRHVPLGLSFIDHFRWRRYALDYVVTSIRNPGDFNCVTEFWVADGADQERIAAFAGSPEFELLGADDRR
ncbi:MAG: EthD domain-containing protein [Deltaproteobacteria bacterium]|nr:EthD domain-containing protein [Deltaproteobacteria bacterium]MBW2498027.1 EthD domain-containing protein [Deltaproteobacteria bacterium]